MNLYQRLHTYFQAASPGTDFEILPLPPEEEGSAIPPDSSRALIFVCTAQTFRPAPALLGLEFVIVSSQSPLPEVQEAYDTNARGFDPSAPPAAEAEVVAFRASLITSRAFTATLDGRPAAAGMFNPPVAGISELAGITTLVEYRGRGIAAALTSEMVRVAFQHQVDTPILMTEDEVANRVYRRIGFFPAAVLVRKAPGQVGT